MAFQKRQNRLSTIPPEKNTARKNSARSYEPIDVDSSLIDGFQRLPGESEGHFAAYKVYRDIGGDRTATGTARILDQSPTHIINYSRKYHWANRAAAYDRFLANAEQTALIEETRKRAAVIADRRTMLMEREWSTSQALLDKSEAMVKWPLATQTVSKDGKTTILNPVKWSQYSMVQLIEMASQLARRSLEMPNSYQHVEANVQTQSVDMTTAHMTPEERTRHDEAQALAAQMYMAVMSGKDPGALLIEGNAVEIPAPDPPAWYQPNKGPAPDVEEKDGE